MYTTPVVENNLLFDFHVFSVVGKLKIHTQTIQNAPKYRS